MRLSTIIACCTNEERQHVSLDDVQQLISGPFNPRVITIENHKNIMSCGNGVVHIWVAHCKWIFLHYYYLKG